MSDSGFCDHCCDRAFPSVAARARRPLPRKLRWLCQGTPPDRSSHAVRRILLGAQRPWEAWEKIGKDVLEEVLEALPDFDGTTFTWSNHEYILGYQAFRGIIRT